MMPACWYEISTCLAGTNFTLQLLGEIKFHSSKAGAYFNLRNFAEILFILFFFIS